MSKNPSSQPKKKQVAFNLASNDGPAEDSHHSSEHGRMPVSKVSETLQMPSVSSGNAPPSSVTHDTNHNSNQIVEVAEGLEESMAHARGSSKDLIEKKRVRKMSNLDTLELAEQEDNEGLEQSAVLSNDQETPRKSKGFRKMMTFDQRTATKEFQELELQHQQTTQLQKQKDLFRKFTQRQDPKWAALISLLARHDVDDALKILRDFDRTLQPRDKDFANEQLIQAEMQKKDYIVTKVNHSLAFAKCYLLKSDRDNVLECLKEVHLQLDYILKDKLSVETMKVELLQESQQAKDKQSNLQRQSTQVKEKWGYKDFRWVLQSFGLMASFYNALGESVKCEAIYVRYVQLIEQFFNTDSLETSNAYYLVGIYYFEQSATHKAIACFRKALAIREKRFKPMHLSCSDCLLNLGILYKLRGLPDQAQKSLERALRIRQEAVGVESLPVAAIHEELGKFFLEQEIYKESYLNMKRCYNIRRKIYQKKSSADVERVSTLLVFLHRKIELQIVNYRSSIEKGGLQLLTDIGNEIQQTIQNVHSRTVSEDSFSFLQRHGDVSQRLSDLAEDSRDEMQLDMSTGEREEQEQAIAWREHRNERAMRNYKAKSGGPVDQSRSMIHKSHSRINQSKLSFERDQSPDEDIEDFVKSGLTNAFGLVERQAKENLHPYAISFLLSLSPAQHRTLEDRQLEGSEDSDPLFLDSHFLDSLDAIQDQLLKESKLWLIPRKSLLMRTQSDLLIESNLKERQREQRRPQREKKFEHYRILLDQLIIPEAQDQALLRRQRKNDQAVFKFIKRAPEFIKNLQGSQTTLFRNIMNFDYTLRYFFLSMQPEQVNLIKELLKGRELAEQEASELTWIFGEFFSSKGANNAQMAEAILQDQVESRRAEGQHEVMDHEFMKQQYIYEIYMCIEQMSLLEDFADLRPSLMGIDESFLKGEVADDDLEELVQLSSEYDDIIASPEQDWQKSIAENLQIFVQKVHLKALYLIYRRVLQVYNSRQKKTKMELVRRKTNLAREEGAQLIQVGRLNTNVMDRRNSSGQFLEVDDTQAEIDLNFGSNPQHTFGENEFLNNNFQDHGQLPIGKQVSEDLMTPSLPRGHSQLSGATTPDTSRKRQSKRHSAIRSRQHGSGSRCSRRSRDHSRLTPPMDPAQNHPVNFEYPMTANAYGSTNYGNQSGIQMVQQQESLEDSSMRQINEVLSQAKGHPLHYQDSLQMRRTRARGPMIAPDPEPDFGHDHTKMTSELQESDIDEDETAMLGGLESYAANYDIRRMHQADAEAILRNLKR